MTWSLQLGGAVSCTQPRPHISNMAQQQGPPETIHVLLVDDEQLSRFVVGNLLRKCNYAGGLVTTVMGG